MTADQAKALAALVTAIVEVVKSTGPQGTPGGVLYSALMAHGCSLSQFESLMGSLVRAGRLSKRGQLYFSAF